MNKPLMTCSEKASKSPRNDDRLLLARDSCSELMGEDAHMAEGLSKFGNLMLDDAASKKVLDLLESPFRRASRETPLVQREAAQGQAPHASRTPVRPRLTSRKRPGQLLSMDAYAPIDRFVVRVCSELVVDDAQMTECRSKFDSLMSGDAARNTVCHATLLLAQAASQLAADPVDRSRRSASKTRNSAADTRADECLVGSARRTLSRKRSASNHEHSRVTRTSRVRPEQLLDAFVEMLKRDKVGAMEFISTVEGAMEAWPQGRWHPRNTMLGRRTSSRHSVLGTSPM